MKDIQGVQRGECNKCECEEYRSPPPEKSTGEGGVRLRCEYCNHTPVDHVRIIPLGACKLCGDDVCEKYESESSNKYTECQYCGCDAQHHTGAEKLIKKSGASTSQFNDPIQQGTAVRKDQLGNPAQTSQFGLCKCPGCDYPKWAENGHVHDFCSRTCSRKYEKMSPSNFHPWPTAGGSQMSASDAPIPTAVLQAVENSSGVTLVHGHTCTVCKSNPANPGYDWCGRCFTMAQSQKQKR